VYDDLKAQIAQKQSRWASFIDRLSVRAKELYEPSLKELTNIRKSDDDPNKRLYNKALLGVCGQINAIRSKAHDALESEVIDYYYYLKDKIAMSNPLFETLYEFRNTCRERYDELEELLLNMERNLRNIEKADLEEEYNRVIDAFNKTKDKFLCSQCGHSLPIDRIFFINVHIACPACGAQNNFEPGSEARNIQFLAKDLAAKRCEHLLKASENEKQNERDLYHKAHELKLSAIHKSDKDKAAVKTQIEAIDAERDLALKRSSDFYKKYLRAVCDEMNGMLPEFKEHNEKMYLEQTNQTQHWTQVADEWRSKLHGAD
jgi:rubrerythrin